MKQLLLLAIIILAVHQLQAQDSCSIYRKGYFSYSDSAGNTVLVDRSKKFQYEKNTVTKVKTQFRIQWTGNCSYTITQTLTNSKKARKYKNSSTSISILQSDGANGYHYSCNCSDAEKGKGYMKKISKEAYFNLYY